ncbi:MAG: hypothetical protein RLY86_2807 [Pseudomonadota bacterium]
MDRPQVELRAAMRPPVLPTLSSPALFPSMPDRPKRSRPSHSVLALSLALVAGTLAGCGEDAVRTEPVRPVRVMEAVPQPTQRSETYAGEVVARTETQAAFRVGGRMVARLVEVGDRVTASQVLARLDPRDYRLGLEAAESDLARATANATQARADLARYRPLLERGVIAQAQFDRVKAAADSAEALLRSARAGVERARNDLSYADLTAEADGIVTAIRVEAGQVVAPGQTVLALTSSAERELEIDLPESRIAGIGPGTRAEVVFWTGGEPVTATVREVSPAADPITRTYRVRLSLPAPTADAVRLGMTGTARFDDTRTEGPLFTLPPTALFQKGDKAAVWVLTDSRDRVLLRPVEVAAYTRDGVAVKSGLSPGDMVVIAGVHRLDEGLSVTVWDGSLP